METLSPKRDTPDSLLSRTNTGLAQSNTSLTHTSYCYSTQQDYGSGCYGYSFFTGYEPDGLTRPLIEDTRPKITAAIYKCSLKRSPSSEDLYLAAVGASTEDQRIPQAVKMTSSIPEETLNDISSLRQSEDEIMREVEYENKAFTGDKRVQVGKGCDVIDRVDNQNEIVSCN